MKRQRIRKAEYRQLDQDKDEDYDHQNIQMQRQRRIRHENVLEAQIQPGDTLQAIALRYNCTISDLKRLNKIEKEIEIHARKTIKVPINAHTILLNTNYDELPTVHKSGQNSPKHINNDLNYTSIKENDGDINNTSHIQLLPNNINSLDEKLLVASVSLASNNSISDVHRVNNLLKNTDILTRQTNQKTIQGRSIRTGDDQDDEESVFTDPLLADVNDDDDDGHGSIRTGPHAIRGTPRNDFSCSGSDCDISWICLLIFILALCFAIPLIYVIYIAEHPEQFNHEESESFVFG